MAALVAVVGVRLYAWREGRRLDRLVSKNVAEISAAADMDAALLRQRVALALLLLGADNEARKRDISAQESAFRAALYRLEASAETPAEAGVLTQLRAAFGRYDLARDGVLSLLQKGERVEASRAFAKDVARAYDAVAALCAQVLAGNRREVASAMVASAAASKRQTYLMLGSTILVLGVGGLLLWTLVGSVFRPLRSMAREALVSVNGDSPPEVVKRDDLRVLAWSLRSLCREASQLRTHRDREKAADAHSWRLVAVGESVAKLVHDMRNRLGLIGGYAKFIAERPDDAQVIADNAPIIWSQVRKLERMLRQVTDFSRPASLDASPVSMNDLVMEALDQIDRQVPTEVRVETELEPGLPNVLADPDKMGRVIANLVLNAIEALNGGGLVRVETCERDGSVVLAVADDGPGVAPEARERIFDPFFTTKKKGTGLGLAICKQIVEEHGGSLVLESSDGRGATFSVLLPRSTKGPNSLPNRVSFPPG
jgi:signal transduction histidine kinase